MDLAEGSRRDPPTGQGGGEVEKEEATFASGHERRSAIILEEGNVRDRGFLPRQFTL